MEPVTLLKCARSAAERAGEAILGNPDRTLRGSVSGYNTKADVLSNDAITGELRASFPEIPIVSEEGSTGIPGEGLVWIVDPLDGTWNYHHGGAKWSVSIAAVDENGPICGVVHAPLMGETYVYSKGMDRPLFNGSPISPSRSSFPGEWMILVGAPSHSRSRAAPYLENIAREIDTGDPKRPARVSTGMYGRGSMALELCHLASGRIDGLVRFGQYVWDLAGGLCVAKGAECVVETMDGRDASGMLHHSRPGDLFDVIGAPDRSDLDKLRKIAEGRRGSI